VPAADQAGEKASNASIDDVEPGAVFRVDTAGRVGSRYHLEVGNTPREGGFRAPLLSLVLYYLLKHASTTEEGRPDRSEGTRAVSVRNLPVLIN